MSAIKEQFKNRSNIIVAVIIFVALLIFAKIIYLQTSRKDELLAKVADIQRKERIIHATRGNIYASDGKSLLATSIPKYITIFDPSQAKSKIFEENIDSLSFLLSRFFGDMGRLEYKEKITKARKKRSRYLVLGGRRVDHIEKMEIENFPLFREGANKGGGRFETKDFRFLPFNNLASRTIGKLDRKHGREGAFGIEASFDNYLSGKDGKGFYERMAGGVYKPVNSESDIDSEPGLDVVTTIDVNFQDIVESALKNQVFKTQAKYGTAVIMEVATGEIKAIANLTRITSNNEIRYIEDQNYAVIGGTDPGSTFKLASMAALLEKTNLNIDDFGVNCPGEIKHNGLSFTCSHEHGNLTIRQIFEQSCNIGIYTLMKKHFGFTTSSDYYDYLQEFKLDKPSGFQLKGEPYPLLKNTKSSTFSSTTVPWMSIGYESRITPIQMMTFYNAIANDGVWVQPIIVKEIRQGNVTIEKLEANRISSPICSEKTIKKVKLMMEGVVNNGTAKNVKEGICSIAGKTGTSQKRVTGNYKKGIYYTSFIGYFPANSPKYTCIVVIDEPQGANLFGGDVSAPVFRTIADKVFAYDISMHPLAITKANKENLAAHHGVGQSQDHRVISDKFGLKTAVEKDGFAKTYRTSNDSLAWKSTNPDKNIEELMGMSLKDALPLLENKGYRVKYSGFGKVRGYSFVGKNIVALVLK